MIKNKIFGTRPLMVHAPGKFEFLPLWDDLMTISKCPLFKTKLPESVTLITFNNGNAYGHNSKPLSVLEESLSLLGVNYAVLGGGIVKWKNNMKIQLLHDFLKSVDTKYIISCDSSDVFVVNKLDKICDLFDNMGCEALFNAEKNSWPAGVPQRIVDFDKSINDSYFLNSGLWMGTADFARELLDRCMSLSGKMLGHSEQVHYRYCYPDLYPRMQVDYGCKIFQGVNRVGLEEIEFFKPFL